MNSPFILTDLENKKYTVSWPTLEDIRQADTKIKLLKVLFNEIKVYEAGLVIKHNVDEVDILWIKESAYYASPDYDIYLHDHYEIVGVAFIDLLQAENFKEYLEKKLVWKILND